MIDFRRLGHIYDLRSHKFIADKSKAQKGEGFFNGKLLIAKDKEGEHICQIHYSSHGLYDYTIYNKQSV